MSGAERARRCESCGAEIGLTGPCHDCGALPSLEVMGVVDTPSATVAQVSLPRRKQRTATVVVAVVVALVAMSVLWDPGSGDDAAAEADEGADDAAEHAEPTEPDGGSAPGSGANPTARPQPVHEVGPVPGFEDQWLLVVDQGMGRVSQIPLAGGEVVEVLQPESRMGMTMSFPAVINLADGVIIGMNGGTSLIDGTRWELDSGPNTWEYIVGVTDGGTIITIGDELRERSLDGELIDTWSQADQPYGYGSDAVVMDRRVLQSGPHGLLAFDLDTGTSRRVAQGVLVTTAGEVVAISVCDDEMACEIQLLHGPTGWRISHFDWPASGYGYRTWQMAHAHRQTLSPDVSRMTSLDPDRGLEFVDTRTGEVVGSVELPEHSSGQWSQGLVEVVWAPSSETALVIISDGGRTTTVLQVDRDVETVESRQELADAISTASSSMPAWVLSDRGFDPVDPEPQP